MSFLQNVSMSFLRYVLYAVRIWEHTKEHTNHLVIPITYSYARALMQTRKWHSEEIIKMPYTFINFGNRIQYKYEVYTVQNTPKYRILLRPDTVYTVYTVYISSLWKMGYLCLTIARFLFTSEHLHEDMCTNANFMNAQKQRLDFAGCFVFSLMAPPL